MVELRNEHWPIIVFIDIHHQIANKFGEFLNESSLPGIQYASGNTLSEVVNSIKSPRFVLEGAFTVSSEKDLMELMEIFQKAGGGIWGAHSFDCMIHSGIAADSIVKVIEFK